MDYLGKHLLLIRELLYSSSLSGTLSRNALGSLTVRVGALLLAFVSNVIFAHFLSVYEYGVYVFAISWLNILLVVATFGLDKLLVRQIAIYQTRKEWSKLKGIYQFAISRTIFISIGVGLFLCGAVYFTSNAKVLHSVFYLVAVLVPIFAMIRLNQAALQGLNFTALGQFPELIIQPLVLLILMFVVFYGRKSSLIAFQAMILNILACLIALLVGRCLMKSLFPSETLGEDTFLQRHEWIPSLVPLMLVSGIYILNDQLATVLLGFLSDARQVAIFSAAERWSRFTVFMLYSLNPALGPIFASLYARNDREKLQRVITLSAQIIALFALIPLLAFILAPGFFLSVFGDDFSTGEIPLIILGIGQFINAMAGSVGVLLSMIGYERIVVLGAGLGVFINICLGFLLIPELNATGAAIGASVSSIATNVALSIFIFRKLRLFPTALGRLFARRDTSVS